MKKVRLIAVGKLKESYFRDASAEYAKRIGRFADLAIVEVPESPTEDTKAEAAAIEKQCKGYVILFDVEGEPLSSPEFSARLSRAYQTHDTVSLVIGSSRGVDDSIRAKADCRVSFGKATFPHMLFRVMALEQLYRAFSIEQGGKYHK